LPSRSVVGVAHAEHCTEEVLGVNVSANLSHCRSTLQQFPHGIGEPFERVGHKVRGTVRGHGERRRHALLRRHEFDSGAQPAAQRLDWSGPCFEMLGQLDKLLYLMPVD